MHTGSHPEKSTDFPGQGALRGMRAVEKSVEIDLSAGEELRRFAQTVAM